MISLVIHTNRHFYFREFPSKTYISSFLHSWFPLSDTRILILSIHNSPSQTYESSFSLFVFTLDTRIPIIFIRNYPSQTYESSFSLFAFTLVRHTNSHFYFREFSSKTYISSFLYRYFPCQTHESSFSLFVITTVTQTNPHFLAICTNLYSLYPSLSDIRILIFFIRIYISQTHESLFLFSWIP